jgi:hypothetical protein
MTQKFNFEIDFSPLRVMLQEDIREIIADEIKHQLSNTSQQDLKLYSRKEILDLFDICEATLSKRIEDGVFVPIYVGRRQYFKQEDIINIIKG